MTHRIHIHSQEVLTKDGKESLELLVSSEETPFSGKHLRILGNHLKKELTKREKKVPWVHCRQDEGQAEMVSLAGEALPHLTSTEMAHS